MFEPKDFSLLCNKILLFEKKLLLLGLFERTLDTIIFIEYFLSFCKKLLLLGFYKKERK